MISMHDSQSTESRPDAFTSVTIWNDAFTPRRHRLHTLQKEADT
ncbi:hypothetical protein ACFV98_00690 [Streptomyces violascens]